MAIQRLTYKDIPARLRRERASEVQVQLRAIMADPTTSDDQKTFAKRQLKVISRWSGGDLPTEVEGVLDYHAMVETPIETPTSESEVRERRRRKAKGRKTRDVS